MIKLKDLINEAFLHPSMYKKIEGDLKYIVGIMRNPVGSGAIDQVHDAAKNIRNDIVREFLLDVADSNSFTKKEVERAFEESGLDGYDFYEMVHKFYDEAL